MQQDNATFFANAESIEEFWILDFRFWIGKLPLKLRG
jgi:hypothetical protein